MKNFTTITMPGGEQHVTYVGPREINPVVRVTGIVTAGKIIAAGMACEVYSRIKPDGSRVTLEMPYFPGARQDRISISEVGLSVEVYANIVAGFKCDSLVILDPHSEVTIEQIKKTGSVDLEVVSHEDWFLTWIEKTTFKPGPHKFLFPDKGAALKYGQVAAYSQNKSCSKRRDPETGKLSGFDVPYLRAWEDNFIWIVDDICDGGGTFIAIAEEVRKQIGNKCKLGLAVSHGVFSKGVQPLLDWFDFLVTTDSVYEGADPAVHVQLLDGILLDRKTRNN